MLERAKNKSADTRAFTIAEALVATIILLLVTVIVATGIPAAIRAYDRVVLASNAEVLLSTTMSSLRNELGTAKDVNVSSNKIVYYSEGRNSFSEISIDAAKKDIMIRKYAPDGIILTEADMAGMPSDPERLISKEASDKKMELHVTYDSVNHNNGIVTFSGLKVLDKNGQPTRASRNTYSVRIISEI